MRTLIIIAAGLGLLGVFVLIGRFSGAGLRPLLPWFAALWIVAAGVNMWIGVSQAGYSVMEELPIFFLIAGVPIAVAVGIQMFMSRGAN